MGDGLLHQEVSICHQDLPRQGEVLAGGDREADRLHHLQQGSKLQGLGTQFTGDAMSVL